MAHTSERSVSHTEKSVPHKGTLLGPAGQCGCRTMSLVLPTLLCLGESGREGTSYKYRANESRSSGSIS